MSITHKLWAILIWLYFDEFLIWQKFTPWLIMLREKNIVLFNYHNNKHSIGFLDHLNLLLFLVTITSNLDLKISLSMRKKEEEYINIHISMIYWNILYTFFLSATIYILLQITVEYTFFFSTLEFSRLDVRVFYVLVCELSS